MLFKDLFIRSWKNVLKSRVRFILTSLSLAVGAFTISLTLAITTAASQTLNDSLGLNVNNDIVLVTGKGSNDEGALRSEEELEKLRTTNSTLTEEDITKIRNIKSLKDVEGIYRNEISTLVLNNQEFTTYSVYPLTIRDKPELLKGKMQDIGSDGIFLPESYLSKAKLSPQAVIGQKATVGANLFDFRNGKSFISVEATIKGIIKSNKNVSVDRAFVSVAINNQIAEKLAAYNKRIGISNGNVSYQLINTRTLSQKDADIATAVRALKEAGYKTQSLAEGNKEFLDQLNVLKLFLLGIGGIAILAAVFGVINTQYMSVYERTREIGIFKALGMSKGGILALFSLEAAWIGVAGSVIGIVLSIPVIFWINSSAGSAMTTKAVITLPNILIIVVSLGIVALVSGLLPARRAAKLDPIEALRAE